MVRVLCPCGTVKFSVKALLVDGNAAHVVDVGVTVADVPAKLFSSTERVAPKMTFVDLNSPFGPVALREIVMLRVLFAAAAVVLLGVGNVPLVLFEQPTMATTMVQNAAIRLITMATPREGKVETNIVGTLLT